MQQSPSILSLVRRAFRYRRKSRKGARGDAVYEYRSYHMNRRPGSHHGHRRPIPQMQDSYVSSAWRRGKRPFDFHALRNTPDMAESDRRFSWIDSHFGKPPGGPVDPNLTVPRIRQLKGAVRGHLYQSPAIRSARAELHVSIVREIIRPMLHLSCQFKDLCHRCANEFFVYGFHRASERHRAELERMWELGRHLSTGVQLVVTRNPRRR
jgi:hypothetical protein